MFFTISKSLFLRGLQCYKSLWLYKYNRKVITPPDIAQKAIFEQGHKVGRLARELYPGGKEVPFDTKPFQEKFKLTSHYINVGESIIYEAAFQAEGLMCMVDILYKGDKGWEIVEVKSSTGEKEVILNDLAFQYYVLTKAGITVNKVKLIHINNEYQRNSNLDLNKLFKEIDLTPKVLHLQRDIKQAKEKLINILSNKNMPDIAIGTHCKNPYTCDFKEFCWAHIPKYSIFDISGMKMKQKFELYYQGIINFQDIPGDCNLTKNEKLQVESELSKKDNVDQGLLNEFLNTIYYPIYFLDFESFQNPIPPFPQTKPYQQIPFQYSLHILNSPFDLLSHKEFLAEEGKDPRKKLAKSLVQNIPANVCILVYNSQFEKSIIKTLADLYPEYADKLLEINKNIIDLMKPFKQKIIYKPEMKGSYSIKNILPALVPNMNYNDLEINEGMLATLAYSGLTNIESQAERDKIKENLLKYCQQDTLAMVKILAVLKEMVS